MKITDVELNMAPETQGYVYTTIYAFCPWCEKRVEFDEIKKALGIHACRKCKEVYKICSIRNDYEE